MIVHFKIHMEKSLSQSIKTSRSDGCGEFISTKLKSFLATNGINHQITCPYTLAQNGVAECKHRHIVETIMALLQMTSMPISLWAEATLTVVYLINRLPTPVQMTPYQRLFNNVLDYNFLRIFGSLCYPWLRSYASDKLQPCSKACVFLGYCPNMKGYR